MVDMTIQRDPGWVSLPRCTMGSWSNHGIEMLPLPSVKSLNGLNETGHKGQSPFAPSVLV